MYPVRHRSVAAVGIPWGLAWRLAAGQIVAWGILYYSFAVIVGPMQEATGWSRTFLNSGLSLGLLTWGLCAVPVGAWIQRHGGRGLMAAASAVGGGSLIVMGTWTEPVVYLTAWLGLGAAMAGLLYDSAFAVVTRAFGPEYRRGITLITLVGGLASTAFIPLAQFAVDRLGWPGALTALGLFQVSVGVPLHWFGLPGHAPQEALRDQPSPNRSTRLRTWWLGLRRDVGDQRFLGLALWFTAHAAAFTGLMFHLVPALQQLGVSNATILQAIMVIGPLQVLGRFMLAARGGRFSGLQVGKWAISSLALALLVLWLAPATLLWLLAFAALYGAGNGVTTIVRGTAVAELFGRERYAELNGALSAPSVLAKAAAPLALAGVWTTLDSPRAVFGCTLLLVILGALGLRIAARAERRRNFAMATHTGTQAAA